MGKKKQPSINLDDDRSIFLEAMKGVRPLDSSDKVIQPGPKKRPLPNRDDFTEFSLPLSDPGEDAQLGTEEFVFFHRGGLQQSQLRKLKRGQLSIADELDLHGLRKEQAAEVLSSFILHCQTQGDRYVRVIHGKGHRSADNIGVLKSAVCHWLRQTETVIAFASAPPAQGGTGAVNIILKRIKEK